MFTNFYSDFLEKKIIDNPIGDHKSLIFKFYHIVQKPTIYSIVYVVNMHKQVAHLI